jgi:two-component system sensor histidine kinase BarA
MSYRAFKRLLGETSLERKCLLLLGGGILLLMSGSFWLYARRTEVLAYRQTTDMCRMLVSTHVASMHVPKSRRPAVEEFQRNWEQKWPPALRDYRQSLIVPDSKDSAHKCEDADELAIQRAFLNDPDKSEETRPVPAKGQFVYYGAIRAHAGASSRLAFLSEEDVASAGLTDAAEPLPEGTLIAVVRIKVPIQPLEEGFHVNRAWLLSLALGTAILTMAWSYVTIRYVIVKPVKHLKEVSDTIAAGELNVRSEIQTGDEFEDLSHAFNRMLRNLVSMQEQLKKVNADLDRKVDELARMNMALYESNRLKSDFLATMSHELRTPLHSILGFSEVLLSQPLSEKQARWVGNIQTSGQQLLALINDLLDLAKIEAGKMQLRLEEFALAEVAEEQLTMFRPLAEKKRIDLRGQVPPDLPLLRQDAGKLRQVLSNLLSNAVKFTPEGGRVVLRAEADQGDVVLTVADTGVGIAPEDQERVFEKFRQAANPLTREQGGTGLGLSIVRELTKLLGGSVTLQSELGRGSTFTVRLPRQLREEPKLEFDTVAEPLVLPDGRTLRLAPAAANGPASTTVPASGEPAGAAPAG